MPKVSPVFIIIVLFFASGCTQPDAILEQEALANACDYLWTEQNPDGAWRSETHGIMKNGLSLTPFILNALLDVPESKYSSDVHKIEESISFIRKQIHEDGALRGSEDFVLDYPNYSTAYALRVLFKNGDPIDEPLIEKMIEYLLSQQFTEDRGIEKTNPAYGAWGFGETNLAHGETGHVDLSHTRRILQSLDLVNAKGSYKTKANYYLRKVQKTESENFDGGFFASSVTLLTNKGGREEEEWRSYATATCDGALALLATGFQQEDSYLKAARSWLQKYAVLTLPQGIPTDDPDQWHEVMQFYHLSVRAEVYEALGLKNEWPIQMENLLVQLQRKDGSFLNPKGGPNKENDPLLATAFAIMALEKCGVKRP